MNDARCATGRIAMIIPTWNEEANIGAVLDSLVDNYRPRSVKFWSSTAAAPTGLGKSSPGASESDARIRLIDNEARFQSAAINLGASYRTS